MGGNAVMRRGSDITACEIRELLGRDDPVIVEVGCNDGETTAQMLAAMPRARVFCFDPEPRAIARNTVRNDPRVRFCEVAISHRAGIEPFNQSGGAVPGSSAPCAKDWDYSGSLCRPTGHLQRDKFVKFPSTIQVETVTLDAVLPVLGCRSAIDLIFADVQGAEARLILGGQQTLARTRWFYCEFYNTEQYNRQPDLKGLLSFLPDWELVGIYADNALFRNLQQKDQPREFDAQPAIDDR